MKEYDASGLLHASTDPGGTITYNYNSEGKPESIVSPSGTTTIEYDDYGYQDKLHDIDAGTIDYDYNGFGELISQTDPEGNHSIMQYDALGRIAQKEWSGGETISYTYNPGTGLLTGVVSENGSKAFTYDQYYRVSTKTETVNNNNFTAAYSYDSYSNMTREVLNNSVTLDYVFNGYGYPDQVSADNQLIWEANSMNRYGQVDDYTLGNGVNTVILNDQNGFFDKIETKLGSAWIQDWDYDFEASQGNLTKRIGINPSGGFLEEDFTYDDLNRLRTYAVGSNSKTITYDPVGKGNISAKTDVGDFYYSQTNTHKLDSILNLSETIPDLPQQEINYTRFNKISTLTHYSPSLTKQLTLTYGPDEQRVKTVYTENSSTIKTRYFALGNHEKEIAADNSVRELYYVSTPTGLTAIIEKTGSQTNFYYVHTDIVGSFDVITNSSGTILERLSFDPWGRRRNPADWTYTDVPTTYLFDRGFTGHEHLDKFDLINMNGRVYDPILAMFLSPDNFVQAPDLTHNFNRYAYCLNNPLKYTDPDGEWFITALVTLANMYLSTSASNDFQFNPLKWDWSSPKTWVSLVQSGIAGYKMGSSAEKFINQRSFDRKIERLSEKIMSEYMPNKRFEVSGELMTDDINPDFRGSLNHNVINSDLYFQGNDLVWRDLYSDGTIRYGESWQGISGPWPKGPAPEGHYHVKDLLSPQQFIKKFPNIDLSSYAREGILFKAEMIPQFIPNPFRSLLAIHPDGGIFVGTNGCIGLQESAGRLLQFYNKLKLFLDRSCNGYMDLNIDY